MYIVKIKKGVRPYGSRRFIAKRKTAPHTGWDVDVKSSTKNLADYTHWGSVFGGGADWRSYTDNEVEIISEVLPQD